VMRNFQIRRWQTGGWLLFLVSPRKSNQKEGAPGSLLLRSTLCCSPKRAAAQLALRAQTVLAEFTRLCCAARQLTGDWKSKETKEF